MNRKLPKSEIIAFLIICCLVIPNYSMINLSAQIKTPDSEEIVSDYNFNEDFTAYTSSDSLSGFSEVEIDNVTDSITTIEFYDFTEGIRSADMMVGTTAGDLYLYTGPSNPLIPNQWAPLTTLDVSTANDFNVIGAFATHINGIAGKTTDIYAINDRGYQYYFENHGEDGRASYANAEDWDREVKGQDVGIKSNDVSFAQQIELGGLYSANDEIFVVMQDNRLYVVSTQETEFDGFDRFEEYMVYSDSADPFNDIIFGDIDGNGKEEAIMSRDDGKIYAYQQDGNQLDSSWNQISLLSSGYLIISVDLADIDLDGDLDVISGSTNGNVRVWENTGNVLSTGLTVTSTVHDFGSENINDLISADFDMDGDIDIACGLDNGTVAILENPLHMQIPDPESNPLTSTWNLTILASHSGTSVNILKYIDLDDDNDLDIVAGFSNGLVYGYENPTDSADKPGEFQFKTKETIIHDADSSISFNSLELGDVDNDGAIEVITSSTTSASVNGEINIYDNPEYDSFRDFLSSNVWNESYAYTASGGDFYDLHLNDIDSDGDLDIIYNEDMESLKGLKNDGTPLTGLWSSTTFIADVDSEDLSHNDEFSIMDLDFDGRDEIIWSSASADPDQGKIAAFRNSSDNLWSSWGNKFDIADLPDNDISEYIITGYFDDDNYLDLATFDGDDDIYLIPGNNSIDNIVSADINNIWTGETSDNLDFIAIGEIEGNKRIDIAFGGSGSNLDLQALLNPYKDISAGDEWNNATEIDSSAAIDGVIYCNLNNDEKMDAIYWVDSSLYRYSTDGNQLIPSESSLIETLSENILDIQVADIDQDGDIDLVVLTENYVYLYINRLTDDVYLPNMDITTGVDNADVTITVTSNETLLVTPQLKISYGSNIIYATMDNANDPQEPLKWIYEYHVLENATYSLTINATDLSGNYFEVSDDYDWAHPLAILDFNVMGTIREDFSNNSVDITITNSSFPVYSDYNGGNPDGDLLVNITSPSASTDWVLAQYQGNSVWNLTYNNILEDGIYTIGVNFTDDEGYYYAYYEKTFTGDLSAPEVLDSNGLDLSAGNVFYTMDGMLFDMNFSEPVIEFSYRFSKWNYNTQQSYNIGDITEVPVVTEGNESLLYPFVIPEEQDGNMNLTIIMRDKSGNYKTEIINITVFIYLPTSTQFSIRDSKTLENNIEVTGTQRIIINWEGVNCTHIQYKVGIGDDGNWSELIPYNHEDRYNYPVFLGEDPGDYNVTVRFYNYHNYVEVSQTVEYTGEEAKPFPWWWFVVAAVTIATGVIVYKGVTKPKEKSWKEYLDRPID